MQKFGLAIVVAIVVALGIRSAIPRAAKESRAPGGTATMQAILQSSQLFPTTAYANNALQVRMKNATRADYQNIQVDWLRNGEPIEDYDDVGLTPDQFQKGDEIRANVSWRGLASDSEPVTTAAVYISNSPPQIIESSANLRSEATDVIYARVNAVDADGDFIDYHYRWFKNGVEVDGAHTDVFDLGHCQAGDAVYAIIVATDGEDESAPRKCDPITIGSGVPQITSQPPQSLPKDRHFVYQLETTVSDARSLTYELLESPRGMEVSNSGVIDWALPVVQLGAQQHNILIRVTNALGGEAYQEFHIAIAGTVDNH